MTIRAIPLVVSAIFLASCLAQSTLAHQVHAAGPQLPDPCMAPVGSVRLFIRGGSETPQWVLHGGGNIFSLSLFPDERNSASPPGDTPGVFSFRRLDNRQDGQRYPRRGTRDVLGLW